MSASLRIPGLMVVSSWLVVSCSSSAKKIDVGGTCVLNSDCTGTLVCTAGKCHDVCQTSADCPAGQSCVKTSDSVICQLPAEVPCSGTSPCDNGLACAPDQHCRTGCLSVANCTAGQICASNFCADSNDPDVVDGQIPQKGSGPSIDGGTDAQASDAAGQGADLAVGAADVPGVAIADAASTGIRADAPADVPATNLPDAAVDFTTGIPDATTTRGETGAPDLPPATSDSSAPSLDSAAPDAPTQMPDAVSLPEGGGASEIATGCASTPVSTRYFCDDFESGMSKWMVSGSDWNTTTSTSRSPTHSATDSPNGNYAPGVNAIMAMAQSVDLTSATAPVLAFWYRLALYLQPTVVGGGPCDVGHIEISSDGGSTWKDVVPAYNASGACAYDYQATALTAVNNTTSWTRAQYDLSTYKGKRVMVQFRLASDPRSAGADGWYIDDVMIQEPN